MQRISFLFLCVVYGLALIAVHFFTKLETPSLVLLAGGYGIGCVLIFFLDAWTPLFDSLSTSKWKETMQQAKDESVEVVTSHFHTKPVHNSIIRSYLFLVAYFATGFFVVTSTNGYLGKGVVLGLGVALLHDLVTHSRPISLLKERWFSVFPVGLNDKELQYFVWVCTGLFIVLSVFGFAV